MSNVQVKPLEWEDWSAQHRTNITAMTQFGRYGVIQLHFPEMHYKIEPPVGKPLSASTLEAAKAAAQADYEARIRSAFIPAPAPAEQEPVAWRYRSAEGGGKAWSNIETRRRSAYGRIGMEEQPLYAHPAPVPAVGECLRCGSVGGYGCYECIPQSSAVPDDVAGLIADAWTEAQKAMQKFPQPNYVISKVAEEAGEVVKAAIHCAEGRETPEAVRAEMVQCIAMLFRLYVEGDQVHGLAALTQPTGDA